MKFEKLLKFFEKKDHLIKKLSISDDEKQQLIDFFAKHADMESEINWQDTNLKFDDFKKVLSNISKSARKKSVKTSGVKGLVEGEDYLELTTDGTYKAYLVLNFQSSILIASNKVGNCVGKWCTAFAKDISFWKDYSKSYNIIYIVTDTEKYALLTGKKNKSDISVYNKMDYMYVESPKRLWLNKLNGSTQPMTDFDKSMISLSKMYELLKNNQDKLNIEIDYLKKYRDGNVVDLRHVIDKAVLSSLLSESIHNLNLTYVLPNNCSELFEDDRNIKMCGSNWDTSNVTNMSGMFHFASSANPDVSKWDVSKVTDMSFMFYRAASANPDVSKWNVSSVTSMYKMFANSEIANPDVSNWDVSSVANTSEMFYRAVSANPDVSKWDVLNLTMFVNMFLDARKAVLAKNGVSNWLNYINMKKYNLKTLKEKLGFL